MKCCLQIEKEAKFYCSVQMVNLEIRRYSEAMLLKVSVNVAEEGTSLLITETTTNKRQ